MEVALVGYGDKTGMGIRDKDKKAKFDIIIIKHIGTETADFAFHMKMKKQ